MELTKTYDIALELAELRRGPIQQMPHRETNRSQAGAHRCPRFPRWICSVNRCRKRRTELENMCRSFFKCETAPQATDEEVATRIQGPLTETEKMCGGARPGLVKEKVEDVSQEQHSSNPDWALLPVSP